MTKVLMLGWEFPPNISGGLGTACFGITRGLRSVGGVDVRFVIPMAERGEDQTHVKVIPLGLPIVRTFKDSQLSPLSSYGRDLLESVYSYERQIIRSLDALGEFDVIHAHDWLTSPAACAASRLSGKPMILHIHSTEFDRAGADVDPAVVAIEKQGMDRADKIVAVSHFMREVLTRRYHQDPAKIVTIYNAADPYSGQRRTLQPTCKPIVSFIGRITHQKGPAYFIEAAQRVLERIPEARFVMAGDGDLRPAMVQLAESLGLRQHIYFPGFLKPDEVKHLLQRSHVYVMPSVSEPFGIAALEAIGEGVPTVLSKQSGVAETINNACKVDHWDVEGLADAMVTLATDLPFATRLAAGAQEEQGRLTWASSARQLTAIYAELMQYPSRTDRG